jgi:hypothetical protein
MSTKVSGWAIVVIWSDGKEEYLKQGVSSAAQIARFASRAAACYEAEFMKIGMDEGEYQSVNIVPYPSSGKVQQ